MVRILMLGTGSLGSQIALMITKLVDDFVLVDKDIVNPENLQNSFFPPTYLKMPKVIACKFFLENLGSNVSSIHHREIISSSEIDKLFEEYNIDLAICTFDSIESRKIVLGSKFSDRIIFVGLAPDFAEIIWGNKYAISGKTPDIHTLCSRREIYPLSIIVASYTVNIVDVFLAQKKRISAKILKTKDKIMIKYEV